jgi:hypothetical protein
MTIFDSCPRNEWTSESALCMEIEEVSWLKPPFFEQEIMWGWLRSCEDPTQSRLTKIATELKRNKQIYMKATEVNLLIILSSTQLFYELGKLHLTNPLGWSLFSKVFGHGESPYEMLCFLNYSSETETESPVCASLLPKCLFPELLNSK